MPKIAVTATTEEGARRLAEPLRRLGLELCAAPADDFPTALRALSADVAVVEFAAVGRAVLDATLDDSTIADRTALVVVLTADELPAYEAGRAAHDFLLAPVLTEELAARVRLLLRRRNAVEPEHILRFGDLMIDLANYRVTVAGRQVELTFKEYELLRFLASNRDKVFTREALLNRVWGYDYYGGARTVDVHIRRLRAKIEDGHGTFIETIRNVGYRFRES